MGSILIVDDDHHLRQSFTRLLQEEGYTVSSAASGEQGLELARRNPPDCVVMDIRMPGMDGLSAMRAMREMDERLPIIIMTAFSSTDTAIEATKLGAFDYMVKPFEVQDMLDLIREAVEAGRRMKGKVVIAETAEDEVADADAIIGKSRAMTDLYKSIGRVAPTDALVLIRGESGTGKELVARAIYQHSARARKPYVVINCVAIPHTLLESELFGYEKGAFTGATARRIGKIEQASGGTVFLDEIGDMPPSVQAKLLRLLQEKQIERLGGRETIDVDVRILAATNADLEAAVSAGTFREDLYYRLKVVSLHLPPLRERKEDIPLLASWFLARQARSMGKTDPGLDAVVGDYLSSLPWPGNVRELSNAMQKALVLCRGAGLSIDDVRQALPVAPKPQDSAGFSTELSTHIRGILENSPHNAFDALMDFMGHAILREALLLTGGNRSQAARLLGLSRPTLLARMDKYGLKIETSIKD